MHQRKAAPEGLIHELLQPAAVQEVGDKEAYENDHSQGKFEKIELQGWCADNLLYDLLTEFSACRLHGGSSLKLVRIGAAAPEYRAVHL